MNYISVIWRQAWRGMGLLVLLSAGVLAETPQHREFSRKGADTCLQCHDGTATGIGGPAVLEIFKTPHGTQTNFSQGQCESCHGPVGEHDKKRLRDGETRQPMNNFSGKQAEFDNDKINQVCSSCHGNKSKDNTSGGANPGHWQGSVHQQNEVACTSCHTLHIANDPIKKPTGQLASCGSCHVAAKKLHRQFSNHPIAEGKVACTDCHNPHDSNGDHLLKKDTVNQTCDQCHADKRGPFLWEHEPVSESCSNCHNPHGSNQPSLLKQRAPFLCQQCHGSDGHQGTMTTTNKLLGQSPSAFVTGKSCTNCHSSVHGSNHPSGDKLQR